MNLSKLFKVYLSALIVCATVGLVTLTNSHAYGEGSSDISPYQVGFYDIEDGVAELFLVNPTSRDLIVYVVLFSGDENPGTPVFCRNLEIGPNELIEVEIREPFVSEDDDTDDGVIKIVTSEPDNFGQRKNLRSGVVAWIRHFPNGELDEAGAMDTGLKSLPASLLLENGNSELRTITDYVDANCGS